MTTNTTKENSTTVQPDRGEGAFAPVPVSRKNRARALADRFGRVGRVLIAGGLITLSVFNMSWNFMAFRADTTEENNWSAALIVMLFTCVVPLGFGFSMLFSSLSKENSAS